MTTSTPPAQLQWSPSTTHADPAGQFQVATKVIRVDAGGKPNRGGLTYWQIDQTRYPDRTFYSVLHDGWYVAECYSGPDGWRISQRLREPIPAAVLAELPEGAQHLITEVGAR